MNCLIIGLGIGQLYQTVCNELGYEVDTVDTDTSKNPTYTSISQVPYIKKYDIGIIAAPNFLHENMARAISTKCRIVLIEKPGLKNHELWHRLLTDYPDTRFMMVKNNQYRRSINNLKQLVNLSETIKVTWHNKNRIPNPGSWFTNKELAFGGVSRDLIPHMLSYYCALTDYKNGELTSFTYKQNHNLNNIVDTDYGVVNKDGVYDVDDFCELKYNNNSVNWVLSANWKTDNDNDASISFNAYKMELGLCPEYAYKAMIETAIQNLNNDAFWIEQYHQDMWIHKQIEVI
jgi:predicted dehydrogenase